MYKRQLLPYDGTLCEVCGEIAEVREHTKLTDKILRQPFYYKKWYCCRNSNCRRTIFMKEEDKVLNNNSEGRNIRNTEQATAEQTSFFNSL